MMGKRPIEVFSAGCPVCREAVEQMKALACQDCDVRVLDVRFDKEAQAKARQYGIKRVPALAVNGRLAECCRSEISVTVLRNLGVGVKL